MEPQQQIETETVKTKPKNPARKWLLVSLAGFLVCIISISLYLFRGGSHSVQPIPKTVMGKVFGFTPYYFIKDSPSDHLRLQTASAAFLGNTLSFNLTTSNNETIKVDEKTSPEKYTSPKGGASAFDTSIGSAVVSGPQNGHNSGALISTDNTLITVEAPDTVSSRIIEDILRNLTPIPKGAEVLPASK